MYCMVFRMFKNVEDAVEFLFTIPDEEQATAIDIALELPDDGAESDDDDPSEDVVDVGVENISWVGAKLLAKPPMLNTTTEILVMNLAIHGAH